MQSCSFSQQIYGCDHKSFTIYITIASKYVNYPTLLQCRQIYGY